MRIRSSSCVATLFVALSAVLIPTSRAGQDEPLPPAATEESRAVAADLALVRELGDRCPPHVFRRLANSSDESVPAALRDVQGDESLAWRTRSLALSALARCSAGMPEREEECLEVIASWLAEGSGPMRRAAAFEAANALGRAGEPVLRTAFLEATDTVDRTRAFEVYTSYRDPKDYAASREIYEKGGKKAPAEEKRAWSDTGALGRMRDIAFDVLADEMRGEDVEDALEDRSLFIRERANRVMQERNDDDVPKRAEAFFEHKDTPPQLRKWSAEAIADQFDRQRHFTYLFEEGIATKFDPEVRNHVAREIRVNMPQRVVDLVRKQLSRGKPLQKLFAIDSLPMYVMRGFARGGGIGGGGRDDEGEDDEPVAFEDEKVLAELRTNLTDKDSSVRVVSLRALVEREDVGALPDIQRAVRKSKDDLFRAELLAARVALRDVEKDLVADAREYVATQDLWLRQAALAALVQIDPDGHEDQLRAALADPWVTLHEGVIEAMLARNWGRAPGLLVDTLESKHLGTRDRALAALQRMTGRDLGPRAADWIEWWVGARGEFSVVDVDVYRDLVDEWGPELPREDVLCEFLGVAIRSQGVALALDLGPDALVVPQSKREFRGTPATSFVELVRNEGVDLARESGAIVQLMAYATPTAQDAPWDGLAELGRERAEELETWFAALAPVRTGDPFEFLAIAEAQPDVEELILVSSRDEGKLDLEDLELARRGFEVRNTARRLVVHGVALGTESRVLRWLAETSGGTYRFVP